MIKKRENSELIKNMAKYKNFRIKNDNDKKIRSIFDNVEIEKLYFPLEIKNTKFLGGLVNIESENYFTFPNWLKIIKKKYLCFLFGIIKKRSGELIYIQKLRNVVQKNLNCLKISFKHLVLFDPLLAIWIVNSPNEVLKILIGVNKEIMEDLTGTNSFSKKKITLNIIDYPLKSLIREISPENLNKIVKINGTLVSKNIISAQLGLFKFICLKCMKIDEQIITVLKETNKLNLKCKFCISKGPFKINNFHWFGKSFEQFQIEELKKDLPIGCISLIFEVYVKKIISEKFSIGEELEITGIPKIYTNFYGSSHKKIPRILISVEANNIKKNKINRIGGDFSVLERKIIICLLARKELQNTIINSIGKNCSISKEIKTAASLYIFQENRKKKLKNYDRNLTLNLLFINKNGQQVSPFLRNLQKVIFPSFFIDNNCCSSYGVISALKRFNKHKERQSQFENESTLGIRFLFAENFHLFPRKLKKYFFMEKLSKNLIYQHSNPLKNELSIFATYDHSSFISSINQTEEDFELFDLILIESKEKKLLFGIENDFPIFNDLSRYSHQNLNEFDYCFFNNGFQNTDRFISKEFKKTIQLPTNLIRKYVNFARVEIKPYLNFENGDKISKFYLFLREIKGIKTNENLGLINVYSVIKLTFANSRLNLRNFTTDSDLYESMVLVLSSILNFQTEEINKSARLQIRLKILNLFKKKN